MSEERFYEAEDLKGLPQWTRTRGNEWTTVAFRQLVFTFKWDSESWHGEGDAVRP